MQKLKAVGRTVAIALLAVAMFGGVGNATKLTPRNLKGPYIFGAAGFSLDDNDDFGEVAAAGVMTFDGVGGVSGIDLSFSGADSSGDLINNNDNWTCNATISSGTYTVNADGTGTLTLTFASTSTCFASAQISFFFGLNRGPHESEIVSTTFTVGMTEPTTPLTEDILSLVLKGNFVKRSKGVAPGDP
ncbi:MAG TPA: hypothetical protein VIX59_15965 [Candidatus Binataceae bacterium]